MNENDWNPGKLFEISGYYWQTCTLHAAVKLDIFTIIGKQKMTGRQIAEKLSGDKRGITTLLNGLSAMTLLEKKGEYFSNNAASFKFLSKKSPAYIGHIIMHHSHLVDAWTKIDKAVLTGLPVRDKVSHGDEETRESFLMGMFNLAIGIAPALADLMDLSGRKSLLDLGGGPGTYAIHFCLKNPDLKATIFDLPETQPFAEKIIKQFNISNRVAFLGGDYLEEEIPGEYDIAWLSQILHGENPENCLKIIKKAVSSLQPGGLIIIHEFILDRSMDHPVFPALFSLNMLLVTDGGRSYAEEQLSDMLKENNISDIKRIDFTGPNSSGIIMGIKQ